jgi:hypothetical protein
MDRDRLSNAKAMGAEGWATVIVGFMVNLGLGQPRIGRLSEIYALD